MVGCGLMRGWSADRSARRIAAGHHIIPIQHSCVGHRPSERPAEVVDGEPCGIATDTLNQLEAEDKFSFVTQYMVLPPSQEAGVFRYLSRIFRRDLHVIEG